MNMRRIPLVTLGLVLLQAGCPQPEPEQCYRVDPYSPVVLSEIDPIAFTQTDYCGRGATSSETFDRHIAAYCIPRPDEGCDPCMFEDEEIEAEFRVYIEERFEAAECPADYEPEQIIHGCVAHWPENDECCWSGEFLTDAQICDPGAPTTFP